MVKTLAKQFNLKIQYNKQSVGRPKNNLSPDELDWLTTFFERPDITYTLPGMKDHKYMGKKDGESVYKQKRYLLWTLGEIVDIFNGMSAGESGDGCFPVKFGKKVTFRQVYCFVKQHPEFVFNKNIPHSSCLCEICENVVYLAKSLSQNGNELPTNPHDLLEKFSCDSSNRKCMYTNECDICSVAVNVDDFKRSDERSFYKWEKVNGKVVKSSVILSHHNLVDTFNAEVKILKKHIFIKRNQNAFYNYLKENLGDNEVLLQVDYSENYSNKDQQEIQSAYFGHNTFSIFTACAYYRTTDGIVGNKNITVTSNATDHSRIAAHTCTMKVIEELESPNKKIECLE